jgi:hypothetical protein
MVVWIGLAAGLIVCVWGSSRGTLTVGDTVLFITMMQQLYVPLTYFGSYYRQVGHRGVRTRFMQGHLQGEQAIVLITAVAGSCCIMQLLAQCFSAGDTIMSAHLCCARPLILCLYAHGAFTLAEFGNWHGKYVWAAVPVCATCCCQS